MLSPRVSGELAGTVRIAVAGNEPAADFPRHLGILEFRFLGWFTVRDTYAFHLFVGHPCQPEFGKGAVGRPRFIAVFLLGGCGFRWISSRLQPPTHIAA